jgi:serine/threonine protein phosphatase PrpC
MLENAFWILLVVLLGAGAFALGRIFRSPSIRNSEPGLPAIGDLADLAVQEERSSVIPDTPSSSGIPDYASVIFGVRRDDDRSKFRYFVNAGSQRGRSHRENAISRQDNFCVFRKGDNLVVAVSDGVSSATEAHLGSTFLVQNFERLFDESFMDGPVAEVAKWRDLNRRLSQNLVAMFVSRSKREKVPIPESIEELRIEASRKFAATMEVLICRFGLGAEAAEYLYVRLAGDGKLFSVADDVFEIAANDSEPRAKKSQTVRALPIFDGDPIIFRGYIKSGESIALATDGIGDFLLSNDSWAAELSEIAKAKAPDEIRLLDFLNHPDPNSRDDRSIVIVTNC